MLVASNKAVEKLREQLIRKCSEAGIGYRILFTTDAAGQATISLKLDKERQGDKVSELNGLKTFIDPKSATQVNIFKLDYVDDPEGGFILDTD